MITQIILGSLALICLIVATILNIVNMNKQTDESRKKELLASTVLMAIGFVLLTIAMIVSMISVASHTLHAAGEAAGQIGQASGQIGQFVEQNPELMAALA